MAEDDPMKDTGMEYPRISTIAMFLLFGTIIFTTTALLVQLWFLAGIQVIQPLFQKNNRAMIRNPNASTISNLSWWCKLFLLGSELALILFYVYLCENHPPFAHTDRFHNMDFFYFLLGILFLASWFTLQRNDTSSSSSIMMMTMKLIPKNLKSTHTSAAAAAVTNHESHPTSLDMHSLNGQNNRKDELPIGKDYIHDEHDLISVDIDDKQHDFDSTITSQQNHELMGQEEGESLLHSNSSTHQGQEEEDGSNPSTTTHKQNPNILDIILLHRNQTDEWKGWMQCIILLYHYLQVAEVYNIVRVLITCYIWMTGYGHFTFFYSSQDYSLHRILRTLWRLNFLVLFTSLTLGTPYILYYSCPLHTFYFLMCFIVMRVRHETNYTPYGLRFKLLILTIVIYGIWDATFLHLFERIHFFLSSKPIQGASHGILYEWYFRSTLDHWSTLLGMIFALNIPIITTFCHKLEKRLFPDAWIGKAFIAVPLLILCLLWIRFCLVRDDKYSYNSIHTYYSFIPVTCYVYFRNISSTLRTYHIQLFSVLGKISLELYILQHHIWLTSSSKTVLTLIPGQPYFNLLVTTGIFVLCSHRAQAITYELRDVFLQEEDPTSTFKSTIYLISMVLFYLFIAFILYMIKFRSIIFVVIFSCVLGLIMYEYITRLSWSSDTVLLESDHNNKSQPRIHIVLSGTLVICFLTSILGVLSIFGSSQRNVLKPSCGQYINSGHWVQVTCSEATEAQAIQLGNVSTIGTCTTGYVWGWAKPPRSNRCVFRRRSSKELIDTLENRVLVFIGDSMMRSLFHSFSTEIGLLDAIEIVTKKHSNFTKVYRGTTIKFFWAPFVIDQINMLVELRLNQTDDIADLVIIGGGAWDALHRTSTEAELILLNSTLEQLKEEIDLNVKRVRPVVWLSPTRIYDPLLTEEKQKHMTESKMAWMRALYREIGIISAASLHIDGFAYTQERVNESFDGVHYPKSVYSAGVQILSNSFDWLLWGKSDRSSESYNEVGVLSNPFKGLITMTVAIFGIYKFDSFLGLLYLTSSFVRGIRPDAMNEVTLQTLNT